MAFRLIPHSDSAAKGPKSEDQTQKILKRRRRVRHTLAVLPSLLTLGNLLCGFAAVFVASRAPDTPLPWHWTPLTFAGFFVFLGMVFDALDGRVARMTRNTSDLGEQLDSMADMVTFGVAPAFAAVQLVGVATPFLSERQDYYFDRVALVIAGIYVCCTALRLARFNTEVHQPAEADHMSFKGLPSPAAAGTVASLILLHQHYFVGLSYDPSHWAVRYSALGMVAIMLLAALAMVSRLRYVHFTNRFLRGRMGLSRLGKLVIPLLLLTISIQGSLALIFVGYALSAPIIWLFRRATGHPIAPPLTTTTAAGAPAAAPPATPPAADPAHDHRTTA